jgi:hypothetical protein
MIGAMSRKDPDQADVMAAYAAFDAFTTALINDDDATAWSLLYPPAVAPDWWHEKGIAKRYRESQGVGREGLRELGTSMTARIIRGADDDPDALVAFAMVELGRLPYVQGEHKVVAGPTPAAVVLALIQTDDGWKVWGPPPGEAFQGAETMELVLPTSPGIGPIS